MCLTFVRCLVVWGMNWLVEFFTRILKTCFIYVLIFSQLSFCRVSLVVSTVLIPKTNSALGFSAGFRCVAFSSLHQTSFNLTQSPYPANRVLTLHKSDCVWQNGGASSRFLHIDFTRINSLCPKHTYTCFCSSFMLVVCWLFLLTKALFSNCCDRRSGGLCDKKLGAKCGLEDIKSPSIPSNASTNWCFLSPSTIYFFSWRELAQRQEDDDTEQVPFLWSWVRPWGNDMMEVGVWMVMVRKFYSKSTPKA